MRDPRPHQPSTAILAALLFTSMLAAPAEARKNERETELRGEVSGPEGEPVGGAIVTLEPATAEPGDELYDTDTDRKGEFELEMGDAAGTFILRITSPDYAPFEGEISLQGGEIQQVQIKLLGAEAGKKREAVLAYNRGVQAFEAKDLETAAASFAEATTLDPGLAPPYLGLAEVLAQGGDYEKAAAAIEKFLELAPDDPQGLRLAYYVYRGLGDPEKLALMLEAIKNTPYAKSLAVDAYNQGAMGTQAQDYDRAASSFENALELDPSLAQAYEGLSLARYHLRQYPEALRAVEKLLELQPESVAGRRLRFLIYENLDLGEKTDEALEAYLEVDPDAGIKILMERAELAFRTGELARSKSMLLEVLESKPDLPRAHYQLGLVYSSEGDNAKAKEHLERFLELAPDDPEAPSARDILQYL